MRTGWLLVGSGCVFTALSLSAFAQGPVVPPGGAAPAPVAAPGGGSDLWINAGLFALLAGGALFAICRGSNRV
jgi:hypothetical protein